MNVFPTPPNAFAVDHGAIKRMEAGERFLAAGAMVGFLHDILEAGARRGGSGRDGKARGEVSWPWWKKISTNWWRRTSQRCPRHFWIAIDLRI